MASLLMWWGGGLIVLVLLGELNPPGGPWIGLAGGALLLFAGVLLGVGAVHAAARAGQKVQSPDID